MLENIIGRLFDLFERFVSFGNAVAEPREWPLRWRRAFILTFPASLLLWIAALALIFVAYITIAAISGVCYLVLVMWVEDNNDL